MQSKPSDEIGVSHTQLKVAHTVQCTLPPLLLPSVKSGHFLRVLCWWVLVHKFVILEQILQFYRNPGHSNVNEGKMLVKGFMKCPSLQFSSVCASQCKKMIRNECTPPFVALALVISEQHFNQRIGTVPTRHQKIPKRLRIGLQGFSLKQIGECTLTFMPSSLPNVLLNQSFVFLVMLSLLSTIDKRASRVSYAIWMLMHRPYSNSIARSLISAVHDATLVSRCLEHAVRPSKSISLQRCYLCVKCMRQKENALVQTNESRPCVGMKRRFSQRARW